jgi:peptidoglycan/xylan/chitin deacetylase (PgdA/CDA1 family)
MRLLETRAEGAVPILMYHSIDERVSPKFARFAVSPSRFRAQLEVLKDMGYRTLSVTEMVMMRLAGTLPDERFVVITFDDGFADFALNAWPLLMMYGFTATLYVTAGLVGWTSRWLEAAGEGRRPLVTWDQLRDIADSGIEIGAHTMTHPALDMIDPAMAMSEIRGSKEVIQNQLGRRVESFAYPFGYKNAAVCRMVADAGFTSACGVRYAMSDKSDDPFCLARYIVPGNMSLAEFTGTIQGRPPRLANLRDRARSAVWSTIRPYTRSTAA